MKTLIYLIMGFCHNYFRSMAQEYSTGLGDTDIPVDVDIPINSTVVSLSRVFPTGTDFTITSLNFISRSTGDSEDVAVFSFNSTENTLRSQEPLTRFLGGVFRMRVTVVFNDTGIEVGEEIRLPVVDKTHCLRMVLKDGGLAAEGVERQELDMLHQLRNAVDMHGRNLLLVPEYKSHGLYPTAKQATSREEFGFYVLQSPGFAIPAAEILPQLQRDASKLMEFLHYRLQIRRITTCERTGFFHLDGLSIGLLVLAILLAISLIAGIIFVCCWIRIRRLRAVVKAAQPPPSLSAPSEFDVPKTPQFLTRPYHISSGWSSFGSIPTFTYGMTDPVFSPPLPVTLTRKKPPSSSCAANYEWQESTLDLAADNDSLNKVPLPISSSSSSAPSLPEDSGSHISRVSINYHRSDSPENTAL